MLPRWLGYFERLLGDRPHFAGTFSFADLAVAYLIEALRENGLAGGLAETSRLVDFEARVSARPKIARHLSDPARFPPQLLPT